MLCFSFSILNCNFSLKSFKQTANTSLPSHLNCVVTALIACSATNVHIKMQEEREENEVSASKMLECATLTSYCLFSSNNFCLQAAIAWSISRMDVWSYVYREKTNQ